MERDTRFTARGFASSALIVPLGIDQEAVDKADFLAPDRDDVPCVDQRFPACAFRGETHLHTACSTDAGRVGCALGPEEAYRFDRGEAVRRRRGRPVKPARTYDLLVVPDGRNTDMEGRCNAAVGNTVNIPDASYKNTPGSPMLRACWEDSNFDPREHAFNRVRVIEIPMPHWNAYDARLHGMKMAADVPMALQERTGTSPVRYTPGK
jgi:hypothetical protein